MKKILTTLLINGLLLLGCSEKPKMVMPPHHVDVLAVKTSNVPYGFDYPASISGVADFPVIARVSGIILKQLYKEGTFVKKGDPLYQIDPRPFEANLLEHQGQLIKDQTAATENKSILDRYKKLYKVGGVSKQDVETQTITYKQAVGLVQADKGLIENDKLNIKYCSVDAPVDGLISQRVVSVGAMITAYQTVLNNINSKTNLYVNFSVPENDRLELQNGIAAGKVSVPKDYMFNINLELADGTKIESAGLVNFFDTRISMQNGTWGMRADVNNAKLSDKLLSGQYVHVYLKGAVFKNAIAIPQSAVFRDDQGAFVYLLGAENKIEKRPIVTGVMNGLLWVIDSGLKNGDKVVVNGGMKVSPGDKVIVDSTKDQTTSEITSAA